MPSTSGHGKTKFLTIKSEVMTFETSTSMIEFGLLGVVALTVILLLALRAHYKKVENENLTELHKNEKWSSPVEARTKYPELDIFRASTSLRFYGIMIATLLMIFAFSWTTYEKQVDFSSLLGTVDDEIEMETPRTLEPPPPPPPPPPPSVQIVATDELDVETKIFEDMSIDQGTEITSVPVHIEKKEVAAAPPPPPPPPTDEAEREIFKVVEDQPTFPGCEDVMVKAERLACAEKKLLEFIYANIQYPAIARENGVSGTVYIRFVVERDGNISNIESIRDIGAGCSDEAIRVVKLMPKWNPGKQRGNPVRVMFTLPVKYELK